MRALILAPFDDAYLDRLRRKIDVVYESWLDTNRLQDPEALGARLAAEEAAILVVEADFVFEETFSRAPGLRFVGVCRNALNQVDVESATEHGVAVVHARGRNTNAVAEMTLGLMLALSRRLVQAHRLVSGAGWSDPAFGYRSFRGREISGATVGIIGFGQIGRCVADKCVALGARVVAYDPYVSEHDMRGHGAELVNLPELLAASDYVTLHVPESDETHHLVDADFLSAMQRLAYLVNTSGGSVVDPDAMAEALEQGSIAGAALDVFEGHPLPLSSPLLSAPNVLLTPHIGGATDETIARHSRMITEDIERFIHGQPLRHLVNPEYLQRVR